MILILGGTSDSVIIANKVRESFADVVLSTATEYGKAVASKSFHGHIICGKKDQLQLETYCMETKVSIIIDATHPYANLVSENAIKACEKLGILYIRYERHLIQKDEENYTYCHSYEEAREIINQLEGNVLITTGSKNIERILTGIQDRNRAFVRVLPQSHVIEKLEKLHVLPDQIIAMKGPFSKEFNKAFMEKIECKILITKESGSQGKTEEKLQAAKECHVKVIIIDRPKIHYPTVFYDINGLIDYVKNKTV